MVKKVNYNVKYPAEVDWTFQRNRLPIQKSHSSHDLTDTDKAILFLTENNGAKFTDHDLHSITLAYSQSAEFKHCLELLLEI